MKNKIKKYFEIHLISIARKILIGRNVHRSLFVSRRDNNDMYYMAERLESIEKRMRDDYKK